MCKQLIRPVLKTLKPKRSGMKFENKLAGLGLAKILYFVTGRAGFGTKFQFIFRTWSGYKILIFTSGWEGPGPEKSGPCRSLFRSHKPSGKLFSNIKTRHFILLYSTLPLFPPDCSSLQQRQWFLQQLIRCLLHQRDEQSLSTNVKRFCYQFINAISSFCPS